MSDQTLLTFWEVLQGYRVEIPPYQRDYAQGRPDDRTRYLRRDFAKCLAAAAKKDVADGASLDLGLVFGAVRDGRFEPVDGQQRLTTLYLLHWLLALRAGELNTHRETFKRFTYATRSSSREFFELLATYPHTPHSEDLDKPTGMLRNSTGFCVLWERDPTVAGALTMLEALTDALGHHDADKDREHWTGLIDLVKGSVQFTCSQVPARAAELYIKMNARGRQLTDFENFKAWLGGLITSKVNAKEWSAFPVDWEHCLDTTWLDIFWRHKDTTDYQVDEEYMRFFSGMAQISIAKERASGSKVDDAVKTAIAALHQEKKTSEVRIPLGQYELWECFTKESIGDAFRFLQLMENGGDREWIVNANGIQWFDNASEPVGVSTFRTFIAPAATYLAKTRFYALCCFLTTHGGIAGDDEAFRDWWRVMRNLLVNTPVNGQTLGKVICDIWALAKSDKPILEHLACRDDSVLTVFSVDEERLKAALILDERRGAGSRAGALCDWECLLVEAENLPFFRGRVGVLLECSGRDKEVFAQKLQLCRKLLPDDEGIRKASFRAYATHIGMDDLDKSRICCSVGDMDWKRLFDAKRPGIVRFLKDGGRPAGVSELGWKRNLQQYWDELSPFDGRRDIGLDDRWENGALLYTTTNISGVIVLDGLRVSWLPVLHTMGAIKDATRFPRSNDCGKYWVPIEHKWLQEQVNWDCTDAERVDIGFQYQRIVVRSRDKTRAECVEDIEHCDVDVTDPQAVAHAVRQSLKKLAQNVGVLQPS